MKRSLFSVALVAIMLFSGQLFTQDEESRWVDSVYNSLTMEQRVGQLICMRLGQMPSLKWNKPMLGRRWHRRR